MFKRSIAFTHELLKDHVDKSDRTVDATAGNGKDARFLAAISEHVFAFDIQKEALARTRSLLAAEGITNVTLIHDSHENIPLHVQEGIKAVVFNLGYLPGGKTDVTTRTDSTLVAIEGALEILMPGGIVAVTVYPGHKEGRNEEEALTAFVKELDTKRFDVVRYQALNRKDAPYPIIIGKRKEKTT